MATVRVDVTFTEQRLRVQLNLQQVPGSVQVDRVEPQSAAHGRVAPGATLVAVNGEQIRPLIGRQAWVAFCERVKNTPRPMTLTFEQPAPAGTVAVPPAAAPAAAAASTTEEEEEEPALVYVPRKSPKVKAPAPAPAPAPRAPPAPAAKPRAPSPRATPAAERAPSPRAAAPASDSSSDDDDVNALRAKAAKSPAKKKKSDPLADLLADEKPKKKKKPRQRSDESTPSFDDVGGMALGRSNNGYASLGAVRSAFAAGRYGAQNTEFLQRFDAWLQREALPARVAEFSAGAHAAAEAWRQGRDYLLARDLCSDAAAADLRRVAALGDGAAGAEFLLAFAHYNALDAS